MSVVFYEFSRWHCDYKGSVEPVHRDMDKLLDRFCAKCQEPQKFFSEGRAHWLKWPARIHYVPCKKQESMFDLCFYVDFYLEDDPSDCGMFIYNYNERINLPFLRTYPDDASKKPITLLPDLTVPEAQRPVEEFILDGYQSFAVMNWLRNGPKHDVVLGFGDDNKDIPMEEWYDYEMMVFRCPLPGDTQRQVLLYMYGDKVPYVYYF